MKKLSILTFLALMLVAKISLACGGLFCDNTQPVSQSAERILFARDAVDQQYQMHVQITYQGPPQEFSWMLPVPPNTEFALSTPSLFTQLDSSFAPIFRTTRVPHREGCEDPFLNRAPSFGGDSSFGGTAAETEDPSNRVQVLSRENVGPYDKALLRATDVQVLIDWLTTEGYQVPPNAEEVLTPYLGNYDFIAIKLLAGNDAGDIRPVALTFKTPNDTFAIPLRPTAVASQPDMGILVHVLGPQKATPLNYALVEINEATIDWIGSGSNYTDVVAQAVDEAQNGLGFTVDFAGPHNNRFFFNVLDPSRISHLADATTLAQVFQDHQDLLSTFLYQDPELTRIFTDIYTEQNSVDSLGDWYYQLESCIYGYYPEDVSTCETFLMSPIDGAALKAKLETEYNDVNQNLLDLVAHSPYLTRLYTTLSPSEMTVDPVFGFNADYTEDVDNTRRAELVYHCETGENILIRLNNGVEVPLQDGQNPASIRRENGETVRGTDQVAAAVIARPLESGQPEIMTDNRQVIAETFDKANTISSASSSDSSCQQTQSLSLFLFALLAGLFAFKQRRSV